MKDPQLRLLPSTTSRQTGHPKSRPLALKTFQRLNKAAPRCDSSLFPRGVTTLYITAVKPEEMSKTDRAYHDVETQRQAIRPDKEAKNEKSDEQKQSVEPAKPAKTDHAGPEDPCSFCVCNRPYERGELMFKCEGYCGNWYHPKCLGMAEGEIERHCKTKERWYCNDCYERAHTLLVTCGPGRKGKAK